MPTKLDLTFQVGDKVRRRDGINRGDGIISTIAGSRITVQPFSGEVYKTDKHSLVFSCHKSGAPFEKEVLDEEGAYNDGYDSGLEWGLKGKIYEAGGPWTCTESDYRVDCHHQTQMCEFRRRNSKAWLTGWADGQKDSQTMEKRIVFQVIGAPACEPFEFMREASDYALANEGAQIITLNQERQGRKAQWKTTSVGGPIDPLPPLETKYRAVFRDGGFSVPLTSEEAIRNMYYRQAGGFQVLQTVRDPSTGQMVSVTLLDEAQPC